MRRAEIFARTITGLLRGNHRRVDFLVCGTQKGGTSALHAYLGDHPRICMAKEKEMHFFDHSWPLPRWLAFRLYHSWFTPGEEHKRIGEVTPIYMYWESAPRRIWEYNPEMKIVVLLRNPIERAYSHWNMERSRGTEDLPFLEAITREEERCREARPLQHRVYSYVDRGRYVGQLRRLWRFFPKNQVLVCKSEDLGRKPEETLREILSFLDVEDVEEVDVRNVRSGSYEREMTERERAYLQRTLPPEERVPYLRFPFTSIFGVPIRRCPRPTDAPDVHRPD